jgi:phage recombination protein Bet
MATAPAVQQTPAGSQLAVIQKVVAYKARDGQDVTLSIDIVKNFLVTGKKELVSSQEFVYFMGVCKARGLNPFAKDCYLIKYSTEAAAIITSIDFYRSRARAQADCTGWEKGVICLNTKTGEVRYSKGLVLPDEELVGGWFKAQPTGWSMPYEVEVNLEGYIKHTNTGEITKFWQKANQPTMIAKVAESQGLRSLWPDEFRGTITAEEAQVSLESFETIDIDKIGENDNEDQQPDTSAFDKLVEAKRLLPDQQTLLQKFLLQSADVNSRRGGQVVTVTRVKLEAVKDFPKFWSIFEGWLKKRAAANPAPAPEAPAIEPEVVEEGPGDVPPPGEPVDKEALKAKLKGIEQVAIAKQIMGKVLQQFKMDKMEDFLDFHPEIIPVLEKFVADTPAAAPGKK